MRESSCCCLLFFFISFFFFVSCAIVKLQVVWMNFRAVESRHRCRCRRRGRGRGRCRRCCCFHFGELNEWAIDWMLTDYDDIFMYVSVLFKCACMCLPVYFFFVCAIFRHLPTHGKSNYTQKTGYFVAGIFPLLRLMVSLIPLKKALRKTDIDGYWYV